MQPRFDRGYTGHETMAGFGGTVGIYQGLNKGDLYRLEFDGGISAGSDIGITTSITDFYFSGDPTLFEARFLEGDRVAISGGYSWYIEGGYGVSYAWNVDTYGNYIIGITIYSGISVPPGISYHINIGSTKIRYLNLPTKKD